MNYSKFFTNLLLNEQQELPGGGNSRTHDTSPDAMDDFLDQGTDPDEFLTQGIQDTFNKVQEHFNAKMSDFANTLSPEAVKTLPLGQLREKLGNVYKFVNKIQIYSNGKIDQISQDQYAIMAAFLASEPTKIAAFEELHGNLDDFQKDIQELEGKLAALKGQIDDFIGDVEDIDAEEAAAEFGGFEGGGSGAPQNDNMMRGNPQSAPQQMGMSYGESRKHKRNRRPIRG